MPLRVLRVSVVRFRFLVASLCRKVPEVPIAMVWVLRARGAPSSPAWMQGFMDRLMRNLLRWLAVAPVLGLLAMSSPAGLITGSDSGAATAEVLDPASVSSDGSAAGPTTEPSPVSTPSYANGGSAVGAASSAGPPRVKARLDTPSSRNRESAVQLPGRIKIPAIGVDTTFEAVGLAADGAMDSPQDPSKVAWYRLGPRPGEAGNAVLAGHVDWGGKPAVFWGLAKLGAGDTVEITAADGRKYEFVVQWQQWYDAEQAPVEQVFGQSREVQLTLITCVGVFDQKTRQYLSRLVVRAALR